MRRRDARPDDDDEPDDDDDRDRVDRAGWQRERDDERGRERCLLPPAGDVAAGPSCPRCAVDDALAPTQGHNAGVAWRAPALAGGEHAAERGTGAGDAREHARPSSPAPRGPRTR